MSDLLCTIMAANAGCEQELLSLIEQFSPLLRKFAFLLDYEFEDAYGDILLAFIELIRTANFSSMRHQSVGCVVKYIHNSMRRSFWALSYKQRRCLESPISISVEEELLDAYTLKWDKLCSENDTMEWELKDFLDTYLSERESEVMIATFFELYSTKELASQQGVTPAIISRIKTRSLKKLRNAIG